MNFLEFDKDLLVALIAINLTLLGLTTLAESRKVLGVDYGNFLLNKATLFYKVKYQHLVIFFTLINIFGIGSLFYTHIDLVLVISALLVSLSTVLLLCRVSKYTIY